MLCLRVKRAGWGACELEMEVREPINLVDVNWTTETVLTLSHPIRPPFSDRFCAADTTNVYHVNSRVLRKGPSETLRRPPAYQCSLSSINHSS